MRIIEYFTADNKEHWLSELKDCVKGFYQSNNDGASASKAQAMFIQKHGKEKFLKVHDKMHETYDLKKTQEILGQDVNEGLKILENSLEKYINK